MINTIEKRQIREHDVIELPVSGERIVDGKTVYVVRFKDDDTDYFVLKLLQIEGEVLPASCMCFVKEVREDVIVLEQDRLGWLGVFISAERLFDEIGSIEDIENCFYTMRPIRKKKQAKYNQFDRLFDVYDKKDNLWIFSYMSALKLYIDQLLVRSGLKAYEEILKFTGIMSAIANWVSEGSGFSANFGSEQRVLTRQITESNIERMDCVTEAIRIVQEGGEKAYVNGLLSRPGYTGNKAGWSLILLKTVVLRPQLLILELRNIISLFSVLSKDHLLRREEIASWTVLFEYYLQRCLKNPRLLPVSIVLTAALGLLYKMNEDRVNLSIKRSMLLRLTSSSLNKETLSLAVKALFEYQNTNLEIGYTWDDLVLDNPLELSMINTSLCISNSPFEQKFFVFGELGSIFISPGKITILSGKDTKLLKVYNEVAVYPFCQIMEGQIEVGCLNQKRKELEGRSLYAIHKEWLKLNTWNEKKERLQKGSILPMTVARVFKQEPKVDISTEISTAKGSLSLCNLCQWKKVGVKMSEIFELGQTFMAEVISDDPEMPVEFSLSGVSWKLAHETLQIGDIVRACLIGHVDKEVTYWVTEQGIFGYTLSRKIIKNIERDGCFRMKVESFSDVWKAVIFEPLEKLVDADCTRKQAIKNLVVSSMTLSPGFKESENKGALARKKWMGEMLNVIDRAIWKEHGYQRFNLLQCGRMLAIFLRNDLSYYYMGELYYMMSIDSFKRSMYSAVNFSMECFTDPLLEEFPDLAFKKEVIILLSYYHLKTSEVMDLLYDRICSEQDDILRILAELIFSANMLNKSGDALDFDEQIKTMILTLIGQNGKCGDEE